MTDRVVQYPNRYKLTLVSGSIYDIEPEPGTVIKQGTPLNKASLLKDQTATALGLEPSDDPTVDDALANVGKTWTATLLAANWTGSGPYEQTVSVAGMSDAYNPNADIIYSSNVATAIEEKAAFAMIDEINTNNGSIAVVCYEDKPEVDLNIRLRGAY